MSNTKVKQITNTSNQEVKVQLAEGKELKLAPGQSVENLKVTNIEEVRGFCNVVYQLNE